MHMQLNPNQQKMAEKYIPLAKSIARKATWCHRLDADERESAALMGLCRAAMLYGPEDGSHASFAAYARSAIAKYLLRASQENYPVHIPVYLQNPKSRPTGGGRLDAADRARRACNTSLLSKNVWWSGGVDDLLTPDDGPAPDHATEAADEQARLRGAIDDLPPALREVILDRLAGLSARQSGERLGISRSTAEMRVKRALKRLRFALS